MNRLLEALFTLLMLAAWVVVVGLMQADMTQPAQARAQAQKYGATAASPAAEAAGPARHPG